MTLLVLAAGMGSRYGGLKQMDPMGPNGETVLDYSVFDAIRAGFTRVVFVLRKDFADDFKEQVGSRFADKIKVEYAFQDLDDLPEGFSLPEGRNKPWGTTHAVLAARELLNEPFAVINADDFYGSDSYVQISKYFSMQHANDGKDHYCMVGYDLNNTLSDHGTVNRGICKLDGKLLVDVEEHLEIKKDATGVCKGKNLADELVEIPVNAIASMNFWGFQPSIIEHFTTHFIEFLKQRGTEMKSECYIPTVVDALIKNEQADCEVLETTSTWFGVTYPDDKEKVVQSINQLIENGDYPSSLVDA